MKRAIYLYKSGVLNRQDNSLILKEKNGNTNYIPIEQIEIIICLGEFTLNKRVLALLNSYNISILFYNFYGNYIGRYSPNNPKTGNLLIKQVSSYDDISKRVYIASTMIRASLSNCIAVLVYYKRKEFKLESNIHIIQELIGKIKYQNSVEDLLLIEVKARKIYYDSFDLILEKESYKFVNRSTRPPLNEFNAMMSYGYSLLYGNYLSALDRSRITPEIAYIHSNIRSKDPLQYDLADILKPIIVVRLIFKLIRRKQIKEEYFDYSNNRCYLNKEGSKFFVSGYEKYLMNTVNINNHYYSYRNLISKEIHELSSYIDDDTHEYKPFVLKL